MKRFIPCLLFVPSVFFAQIPSGYYDGTSGLSGYDLKTKLHDIISHNKFSFNYSNMEIFYAQTDIDAYYENNGTILDIYSENPTGADAYEYTTANSIGSASAEGLGWNREHMMPQSSFNGNYPMYSDLHYVIPADARINQLRSNYPYGMGGTTNYYTFTNGSKISKNGTPNSPYTGRVYEPIDEFKGDVARTMLYFIVRYENKLPQFNFDVGSTAYNDQNPMDGSMEKGYESWFLDLMLQWHNADPVSQREIDRNNAVYNIQKNRNPFIDHPTWVNLIWNQTPDTIAPTAPTNLSVTQNSAHFAKLNWTASSSSDVIGYKIYANGSLVGYSHDTTFYADHLTPSTSYDFKVVAYDNGYLDSADSNTVTNTTFSYDVYPSDLMITKYIEGSSNNKAIEITNQTGHVVDLKDYDLSIQFYSGSNYYFASEKFELDGVLAQGESAVIIHPEANFSCYTTSDANFITNAPQMTFSGSNYLELRRKGSTVDAIGWVDQNNFSTLGNVSLYRNATAQSPSTNFVSSEWDVYPQNYCQNLGGTLDTAELVASKNENFELFPNPAADYLFVKGKGLQKEKSAKILDASGRPIIKLEKPFEKRNSIDVRSLPTGIYYLNLDQQTIKFIKK